MEPTNSMDATWKMLKLIHHLLAKLRNKTKINETVQTSCVFRGCRWNPDVGSRPIKDFFLMRAVGRDGHATK